MIKDLKWDMMACVYFCLFVVTLFDYIYFFLERHLYSLNLGRVVDWSVICTNSYGGDVCATIRGCDELYHVLVFLRMIFALL